MKANIFNRFTCQLIMFFGVGVIFSCERDQNIERREIDYRKVEQVMLDLNMQRKIFGLKNFNYAEKAYAWRKSIIDKSSRMTLTNSQASFVERIAQLLEDPSFYNRSVKSVKMIQSLNNESKRMFDEEMYFTIFLHLGKYEHAIELITNVKEGKSLSVTRKQGRVAAATCGCTSDIYCRAIGGYANRDVCGFDEDMCYTEGDQNTDCGFLGGEVCDGQCITPIRSEP